MSKGIFFTFFLASAMTASFCVAEVDEKNPPASEVSQQTGEEKPKERITSEDFINAINGAVNQSVEEFEMISKLLGALKDPKSSEAREACKSIGVDESSVEQVAGIITMGLSSRIDKLLQETNQEYVELSNHSRELENEDSERFREYYYVRGFESSAIAVIAEALEAGAVKLRGLMCLILSMKISEASETLAELEDENSLRRKEIESQEGGEALIAQVIQVQRAQLDGLKKFKVALEDTTGFSRDDIVSIIGLAAAQFGHIADRNEWFPYSKFWEGVSKSAEESACKFFGGIRDRFRWERGLGPALPKSYSFVGKETAQKAGGGLRRIKIADWRPFDFKIVPTNYKDPYYEERRQEQLDNAMTKTEWVARGGLTAISAIPRAIKFWRQFEAMKATLRVTKAVPDKLLNVVSGAILAAPIVPGVRDLMRPSLAMEGQSIMKLIPSAIGSSAASHMVFDLMPAYLYAKFWNKMFGKGPDDFQDNRAWREAFVRTVRGTVGHAGGLALGSAMQKVIGKDKVKLLNDLTLGIFNPYYLASEGMHGLAGFALRGLDNPRVFGGAGKKIVRLKSEDGDFNPELRDHLYYLDSCHLQELWRARVSDDIEGFNAGCRALGVSREMKKLWIEDKDPGFKNALKAQKKELDVKTKRFLTDRESPSAYFKRRAVNYVIESVIAKGLEYFAKALYKTVGKTTAAVGKAGVAVDFWTERERSACEKKVRGVIKGVSKLLLVLTKLNDNMDRDFLFKISENPSLITEILDADGVAAPSHRALGRSIRNYVTDDRAEHVLRRLFVLLKDAVLWYAAVAPQCDKDWKKGDDIFQSFLRQMAASVVVQGGIPGAPPNPGI